ncbi:ABC transporter permease [Falsarthrobacter nasiphocae]|uniref:Oligopeptide transport system permease protein n=1 Tax=Falsarthrobacter nasiphocae TaxID=189863 RepID=A0AAE4C4M5_9MICC|nr:ABC transporter permease [Falsarthrobacter nasiphocae]MDR6891501.1 oligopeptide transport system permease protein [Falsarthrobacter nasiphocae]
MTWYLVKRLGQLIPVFLGATLLVYFLVFQLPGDPLAAICGEKGCTPGVAAQLREQYHLDEPFWTRYFGYLGGIFTGDLGVNFSGRPIASVIGDAMPVTARLAIMALIFEAVFGIAFGLYAGLKKGKLFDSTILIVSLIVISVPIFVLAFVLQYVIGVQWQLAKPTVSSKATFTDLILPAFVLGLVSFAYVLRLTRTSVAENASADYVRTARAKGLSNGRIVRVHILRNSMIPVATFLGADLGGLMGGAVVTEGIFNVPGIGNTLFKALTLGDAPTVVSIVSLLVLIFCIANLLVDLLYAWLDPRIRYA